MASVPYLLPFRPQNAQVVPIGSAPARAGYLHCIQISDGLDTAQAFGVSRPPKFTCDRAYPKVEKEGQ